MGVRDFTEYKYKFYTDLTKANPITAIYGDNDVYTAVCVKECPSYPIGTVPATLEVDYMVTTTNTKSPIFDSTDLTHPIYSDGKNFDEVRIQLSNTELFHGQCVMEASGPFAE